MSEDKRYPREVEIIVARDISKISPRDQAHYLRTDALDHLDEALLMLAKYSAVLKCVSSNIEAVFATAPHSPEMLSARLLSWQKMINEGLASFGDKAAKIDVELLKPSPIQPSRHPLDRKRKCTYCGKMTRITTAGCDHCDVEDK